MFKATESVCGKEVKKQVQAGLSRGRKVLKTRKEKKKRVMSDKRVSAKRKRKVYKRIVRPSTLFGLEMVAQLKRQEAALEVAEFKMLRFS